jgi:putative PIN family toxin of toxin-antitoxin system
MITAVLDSNVLTSAAIISGGIPAQIIAQAEERFVWLTSEYILAETAVVLARKHIQTKYPQRVTSLRQQEFLDEVRRAGVLVEVKTAVSASSDLKDNPVLACAVDASAEYLVTGDRHLLKLGTFQGIRIVTPSEFLQILLELI